MELIVYRLIFQCNILNIPLVSFWKCPPELIERYCNGGLTFFPNAMESQKLNGFLSVASIKQIITRYDFEIDESKFIDIDVDCLEAWCESDGQEKNININGESIAHLYSLVTLFMFFLKLVKLLGSEKFELIQKICEYHENMQFYKEFLKNCKAGHYSKEKIDAIDLSEPDKDEYNLILRDPQLRSEVRILLKIFNSILYLNKEAANTIK